MEISGALLLLNSGSTLYLVGLIWIVQIVHYPLFALVGEKNFEAYQQRHQTYITFVVGPPMLIEAFSSVLLAWYPPDGISLFFIYAGIVLVFVIWFSTAALQIPCHGKLVKGFDQLVHRRLVRTNWIRTIAWTLRGCLVLWMIAR